MAPASPPRKSSKSRPIAGRSSCTICTCNCRCRVRRRHGPRRRLHAQDQLFAVRRPGGGPHARVPAEAGESDPRSDQERSAGVGGEARHPFDPYPFILLNLVLSTLAALQAPVIMMSQNRQAHKDRMQANQDYEINLMAEIEIRDLHDKLDSLRFKQWHELWHIQKRQIELLEHLCERDANPESKVPSPSPYVPPEL